MSLLFIQRDIGIRRYQNIPYVLFSPPTQVLEYISTTHMLRTYSILVVESLYVAVTLCPVSKMRTRQQNLLLQPVIRYWQQNCYIMQKFPFSRLLFNNVINMFKKQHDLVEGSCSMKLFSSTTCLQQVSAPFGAMGQLVLHKLQIRWRRISIPKVNSCLSSSR